MHTRGLDRCAGSGPKFLSIGVKSHDNEAVSFRSPFLDFSVRLVAVRVPILNLHEQSQIHYADPRTYHFKPTCHHVVYQAKMMLLILF